jgi:hypothetical protein
LTIGVGADAPGMAFTANGKILAAASTDYEQQKAIYSVKLWDMATGKEIRKIKGLTACPLSPRRRCLCL